MSDSTGVVTQHGDTRYPLEGGGYYYMNKDGTTTWLKADGTIQYYDNKGNPYDPDIPQEYPGSDPGNTGGGEYTGPVEDTLSPGEEIIDPSEYSNGTNVAFNDNFDPNAFDSGNSGADWYS
jgi:hypothetical protein